MTSTENADPVAPRILRIASWNVHSCVGRDGLHDPARTSAVIAQMDLDMVALQEFRYPGDIALETRTPVVLVELESYECALGPTFSHSGHCFGNVVLTRHPIRDLQRIDLSQSRREPRGALAVTIDAGVRVHVVATHLGLKQSERRIQVRRLVEHLDSLTDEIVIVLGDFNDWLPGRSVAHLLDRRFGRAPRRRTFPSGWPLLSLDRIWVHPRRVLRSLETFSTPQSRRASDHLPVIAEVALDVGTSATSA